MLMKANASKATKVTMSKKSIAESNHVQRTRRLKRALVIQSNYVRETCEEKGAAKI